MDADDSLSGLELEEYHLIHNQICAEIPDAHTMKENGNRNLRFYASPFSVRARRKALR
jgi:hypothetical protein